MTTKTALKHLRRYLRPGYRAVVAEDRSVEVDYRSRTNGYRMFTVRIRDARDGMAEQPSACADDLAWAVRRTLAEALDLRLLQFGEMELDVEYARSRTSGRWYGWAVTPLGRVFAGSFARRHNAIEAGYRLAVSLERPNTPPRTIKRRRTHALGRIAA